MFCSAIQLEIHAAPQDLLIDLASMKDNSLDDVCLYHYNGKF